MKAPASWIRELAGLADSVTTHDIAHAISGAGFEVASIEHDTIDFEITANRPDCLSVRGLAREASTALTSPNPTQPDIRVSIDSALCGRFALAMADVTVGPSPTWLADRLTACGIRPINTVVDVTNYVMLETGQPLHAYDAARIAGGQLVARQAKTGERLRTLDGQDRALTSSMLVIADRDHVVGIAGVMGGAGTEVSASTTQVALEAAYFQPATVRATSKALGLKTEASTRFERGADINAGPVAIAMALDLLERIGAGRRTSATTDVHPAPAAPRIITLRAARLARLLGDDVPGADVARILTSLGFGLTHGDTPGADLTVTVPSWRVDVAREADLIEEVGRHWGINRIPARFPALRTQPRVSNPGVLRARRLRRLLCGAGLQEAVTFTFMERAAAAPFVTDTATLVAIANPLSEKFAVLRPSLIPGLLDALIYNRRRGIDDVRLFEAGAVFATTGEQQRVGWVLCGARDTHWSASSVPVDVFDALGIAEVLLNSWGIEPFHTDEATPAAVPWGHDGRMATIRARFSTDGSQAYRAIGAVGQVDPAVAEARGLPAGTPVVAGELDLSAFAGDGGVISRVAAVPRVPAVIRDVALLVDVGLSAAALRATMQQQSVPSLRSVTVFDRYQGRNIPEGKVSLAFRLTFQDAERTLTDADVDAAFGRIVEALIAQHGAEVRGR